MHYFFFVLLHLGVISAATKARRNLIREQDGFTDPLSTTDGALQRWEVTKHEYFVTVLQ